MNSSYSEAFRIRAKAAAEFDQEMINRFGSGECINWREDALLENKHGEYTDWQVYSHFHSPKPYSPRYLFAFVRLISSVFVPVTAITPLLESTFQGDEVDREYIRALLAQMVEASFDKEGAVILMSSGEGAMYPKECPLGVDIDALRKERGWEKVFEGGKFYKIRIGLISKWLDRKEREEEQLNEQNDPEASIAVVEKASMLYEILGIDIGECEDIAERAKLVKGGRLVTGVQEGHIAGMVEVLKRENRIHASKGKTIDALMEYFQSPRTGQTRYKVSKDKRDGKLPKSFTDGAAATEEALISKQILPETPGRMRRYPRNGEWYNARH